MLRSCGNPFNHKLQEPAEPYSYHAADPTQGNSFQQPSFNHRPLHLRDDMIFWNTDKGTSTGLALVVLFPRVNAAIPLILSRSTLWTCFSLDHSASPGLLLISLQFWPRVARILREPYLDSTTRDTARVLGISPTTVINELRKKGPPSHR